MTQKGPPSSSLGNDKEGGSGAQQEKEQVKTPVGPGMSARDLGSRRPYPEHPQMSGEGKCQVFLDKDTFFPGLGTAPRVMEGWWPLWKSARHTRMKDSWRRTSRSDPLSFGILRGFDG